MRKRRRGTGYLSDSTLKEMYPRMGLDNEARSGSTASHNRRKPVLLSVGTPEIADLATTTAKMATNAADSRVIASHPTDNLARGVTQDALRDNIVNVAKLANVLTGINANIPDDHLGWSKMNGRMPVTNLPANIPGGYLQKQSVPSDAINALDGSKIIGDNKIESGRIKGLAWTKVTNKPSVTVSIGGKKYILTGKRA